MTLPFDLGIGAAVFMAAALFVAAYVRGYSGFGFAALVVSAASLVTNPLHAVPVVLLADIGMTVQQARGIWRHVDWRRTGGLFAGALIGVPVGVFGLVHVGVDLARAVIAGFVLVMCAMLLAGWVFRRAVGVPGHVGVGVVSGIANGAAVGGLPVAVFFAAQAMPAVVFRATVIAYFTLLDAWSVPLMWGAGLVTRDTVVATVLAMPILMLGIWAGGRHFTRAAPSDFRRFAIYLLAGLAGLGLMKAVV
jgi:uncharacterized protein